jgi:hypothetical protein
MQGKWNILKSKGSRLGFCSHAIRSTPKHPKKVGLLATPAQSLLLCAGSVFERLATNNKVNILGIYFACTLGSLDLRSRGKHNRSKRREEHHIPRPKSPNAWLLQNCLPRSSPLYRLQISGIFGGIVTLFRRSRENVFIRKQSLRSQVLLSHSLSS